MAEYLEKNSKDLREEINKLTDLSPDKIFSAGHFTKASLGLIELQKRENNRISKFILIISVLTLFVVLLQTKIEIHLPLDCDYTWNPKGFADTERCRYLIKLGAYEFFWGDKNFHAIK